ncbi:MAG: hypothetical protein ACTSRT_17195 [Promethearchaeota archaeon]
MAFVNILPYHVVLYHRKPIPDDDGNIILKWNLARYADNYSLYYTNRNSFHEEEVLTLIEEGLIDFNYTITDLVDGYYTFKVVAYNRFGFCSSNLVLVEVEFPYEPSNMEWYHYLLAAPLVICCCSMGLLRKKLK